MAVFLSGCTVVSHHRHNTETALDTCTGADAGWRGWQQEKWERHEFNTQMQIKGESTVTLCNITEGKGEWHWVKYSESIRWKVTTQSVSNNTDIIPKHQVINRRLDWELLCTLNEWTTFTDKGSPVTRTVSNELQLLVLCISQWFSNGGVSGPHMFSNS